MSDGIEELLMVRKETEHVFGKDGTARMDNKKSRSTDSECRYIIDRLAHTETEFEKNVSGPEIVPEARSMKDMAKKCLEKCNRNKAMEVFLGLFPIFSWLPNYNVKQWLPGDIVAGLTVGVVHIPQSMAFSLLAGLPPVFGLYTSFYPVLLYTLMGTSRHISVGTFAVTSLLTQSVVVRLVPDELIPTAGTENATAGPGLLLDTDETISIESRKVIVASTLMFLMGMFQLFFGLLRLGFITTYLSEPLIQAFTTGAALHVVTSQTPSILGMRVQSFSGIGSFFRNWVEIFRSLPTTHIPTLIVSIVCIILLVIGREINIRHKEQLKVPIPTEVIVVAIATISSHFGMFQQNFGITIVDNIPTGIPPPQLPDFSIMGRIIGDAFAIAIVGFAISVSLAKMYAQKHGYAIDSNQELVAYGVSNIIPSFFSCFPNAAALARCVIQENTGGKTQVVGLISVVIVLITILVLGPIFEPLPRSVLGCIIVVGLVGILQQLALLKPIFKMSKVDFVVWIVTLAAVLVLGVDIGLLAGVVFAMFTVIVRTQNPKCEVLGSVAGTDVYRNCNGYASAVPYPGIAIFKFHSVLYYANRDFFKKKLFYATGLDPDLEISIRKKEEERLASMESSHESSGCILFSRCSKNDSYEMNVVPEATSNGCEKYVCPDKMKDKQKKDPLNTVIIDCSAFTFIDLVGMKTLKALYKSYKEIEVNMLLASVCGNVRSSLKAGSYYDAAGYESEFLTVHDASVFALNSQKKKTGMQSVE